MSEYLDIVCHMDEIGLIEKGNGSDDDNWLMYGFASTPAKDAEDERIIQKGLNLDPMLKSGWVNWDHQRDNLIGWPTTADLRKHPDTGNTSLYVEYELIKGMPMAQHVYQLAKALKKSNAPRQLGLSLEGKTTSRSKQGTIVSADVYGFAVTPYPINNETSTSVLMKSILAGDNPDDSLILEGSHIRGKRYNDLISKLDIIAKALEDGYDIGGTSQIGGSASREEEIDSKPSYISFDDSFLAVRDLPKKYFSVYDEFRGIAKCRGGKLTKGEAALLMHLTTGEPISKCLMAAGFNL